MRRAVWPLIVSVVFVGLLFLAVFPTRSYLAQRRQLAGASAQLRTLSQRNGQLSAQVQKLNTDAEIERLAREDYNLVKPGEEAYAILPAAPSAGGAGGTGAPAASGGSSAGRGSAAGGGSSTAAQAASAQAGSGRVPPSQVAPGPQGTTTASGPDGGAGNDPVEESTTNAPDADPASGAPAAQPATATPVRHHRSWWQHALAAVEFWR